MGLAFLKSIGTYFANEQSHKLLQTRYMIIQSLKSFAPLDTNEKGSREWDDGLIHLPALFAYRCLGHTKQVTRFF